MPIVRINLCAKLKTLTVHQLKDKTQSLRIRATSGGHLSRRQCPRLIRLSTSIIITQGLAILYNPEI